MLIRVNAFYALSTDKNLPTFRRNVMASSSESSSTKRADAFPLAHTTLILTYAVY